MKILIKLVKIGVLIIMFSTLYTHWFKVVKAEMLYKSALMHIEESEVSVALERIDSAIKSNPEEPNYYRLRSRILLYTLIGQPKEVQTRIKDMILEDLQKAADLNPENLVTARNLVPLYYFLATNDISTSASEENIDPEYLELVRSYYNQVKNKYPNDVGVYALIAKYEKRLFLEKDYAESVKRVKELRPDLLDWYDSFR